jgi:hypothetical protein
MHLWYSLSRAQQQWRQNPLQSGTAHRRRTQRRRRQFQPNSPVKLAAECNFWAWAEKIDVVRNVWNDIPDSVTANNNAVSYNAVDTFEVKLTVRNLYNYTINNINLKEYLRTVKGNNAWVPYFTFVDVLTPGVDKHINGATLSFNDISLAPHSELIIRYRLSTPEPNAPVHSVVNSIISWSNYAYFPMEYSITMLATESNHS